MEQTLPILIGTAIALVFVVSALALPDLGRVLLGLTMLAGAFFNALWTFPNRDWVLESMAAGALFPFYLDFTKAFVVSNTALFTILVVAFETSVGVLVMSRGPWVKLALLGAIFWLATMWAMAPAEGLIATAIAHGGGILAGAILLRRRFDRSLPRAVLAA